MTSGNFGFVYPHTPIVMCFTAKALDTWPCPPRAVTSFMDDHSRGTHINGVDLNGLSSRLFKKISICGGEKNRSSWSANFDFNFEFN